MTEELHEQPPEEEAAVEGQVPEGDEPDLGRAGIDLSKVPKDMMPYVQAARAQEKQKLYKEQAELRKDRIELRKELATLREQLAKLEAAPPASTAGKKDERSDEISELRGLVMNLTDTIQRRDRESTLRAYRAEKITEAREAGHKLIDALVQGDSEDAIDLAVSLAIAERAQIDAEHEAARLLEVPAPGRPAARPVVVQPAGNTRVPGVPATTTPGSADTGPTMSVEEFKELTSMEAIRDGRYKANRARLVAASRAKTVYTGAGRA